MKKMLSLLLLAAVVCLWSINCQADDREDAVAMVKKAVAYKKANGSEKLIEEANNVNGQFVKGALYVILFDKEAVMLAQPFNPSLIGQPQKLLQDVNGKFMTQEMVDMALSKGSGWVDYLFKNPKTQVVSPKSTYVELADDIIVGCGIYRK